MHKVLRTRGKERTKLLLLRTYAGTDHVKSCFTYLFYIRILNVPLSPDLLHFAINESRAYRILSMFPLRKVSTCSCCRPPRLVTCTQAQIPYSEIQRVESHCTLNPMFLSCHCTWRFGNNLPQRIFGVDYDFRRTLQD